jgi:MFS family permease
LPAAVQAARAAAVAALPIRSNTGLLAAVVLQGINRFVLSGVLSATLGLLVQQQLGASPVIGIATATGILMSGRSFFSMASAPLCGVLSDYLGSRWAVMAASVALGLAGMLLMAWPLAATALAGIVLTSLSSGGIQALASALTGDAVAPAQRGRAIGLLHTSGDLGSALGPPVAYALLPLAGLQGDYLACALLFVLGLALSVVVGRRQRRTPHVA